MTYLAILSLLQKNFRFIQNRTSLREFLAVPGQTSEDLLRYLKQQEHSFASLFCADSKTLISEREGLSRLQAEGVRFCHQGDAVYPEAFVKMPGAPFLFSYEGHPSWTYEKSIAVVGSREASPLSRRWMEDSFADFLRRELPVVVSGGARGIDQMAHQLALRNSCPTVVVLPSGLGCLYPQVLESWKKRIIDGGGCVLSEYSYHQQMLKHFFHDRNRLIAALGAMTLLIEAKRRSGSLITAQRSLELGKSVFVIPGHPSDLSHLGNIDLLAEGATPIRDAEDLCMYFRSELRSPRTPGPIASQISLF